MHLQQVWSINIVSWHRVPNILPMTFTTDDFKAIEPVQEDPMVISVEIAKCIVKKTLVDPHDDPLFRFARE